MKFRPLFAAIVLGGCVDVLGLTAPQPAGAPAGTSKVQLYNAGPVALQQLSVTTGQNVPPITKAVLAPGELSAIAQVSVVHELPLVTATVEGRKLTSHPIEGFSGYNAQLPRGSYVIRLRYVAEYQLLAAEVEQAP